MTHLNSRPVYLRIGTVHTSDSTPREHLRLQESDRQRLPDGGSRHRHRVTCNLGRVDLLKPQATRLYALLTGQRPTDSKSRQDDSMQAWAWGVHYLARTKYAT